ncbi:MAG: FAD-binding oxidoreductase [Oscillospiraceae bacterium]|nr:FAD-binding oxidoreductase [Oscillospiraceae bacterium]
MSERFDAIVVGGGYIGCAVAYRLSRSGVKTLLLEKKEVGSGSSGANFGNVQVQDANFGLSMVLTRRGAELMRTMEEELEENIGYRTIGDLVVAEKPAHVDAIRERYEKLIEVGLDVQWLDGPALEEYEPNMRKGAACGALRYVQGSVYPFWYIYGMIKAGKRFGLTVREHTEVGELYLRGGRCCGVTLKDGTVIEAENVIVTAGPGTRAVCATAGLDAPVKTVKAEAIVTEAIRPFIRHTYASAAFFAEAHDEGGAASSLCMAQTMHGNILIGETTQGYSLVEEKHWENTSPMHCAAIPERIRNFYPELAKVKVIRSYTASSPFTDSCLPVFGKTSVSGLLVAAGFKSTVVMTPMAGRIMADLVTKDRCEYDLKEFITI